MSFNGKVIAITGANGALGRSLVHELVSHGATVIALTTSTGATFEAEVEVVPWQLGQESELFPRLEQVDILIINHGVNVYGARTPEAIQKALEVNALSAWRWVELFLATVQTDEQRHTKEIWMNTSEAEVNPAFSPLYEVSKRLIGELITLRRLDAPCVIRKLILGPFKSQLNPYGVMSAPGVARMIVTLVQLNFRDIIVTINPLTYLFFPVKELSTSLYFRLFSRSSLPEQSHG